MNYGNPYQELGTAIAKSEEIKRLVVDMIQEMDLDIEDFRIEEKDNDRIEVYTKHIVDGYSAEITLSEESSGTKKLFGLLPFIAKSLVYGTTLVIDELDAKIHPLLLKNIIERFTDLTINRKGGQLIFTSHDLSTMNSELFRGMKSGLWQKVTGRIQIYTRWLNLKMIKGIYSKRMRSLTNSIWKGNMAQIHIFRKIIDWGR